MIVSGATVGKVRSDSLLVDDKRCAIVEQRLALDPNRQLGLGLGLEI